MMKKTFFPFILSLAISLSSYSQGLKLSVPDFTEDRVYLFSYYGDNMKMVDSIVSVDGEIFYIFPEELKTGLFHIYLGDPSQSGFYDKEIPGFDFIYDKENISIRTSVINPEYYLKVSQSASNKIYYRYLRFNNIYRNKLSNLLNLLNFYHSGDSFYPQLRDEIIAIQKDYNDSILVYSAAKPGSFVSELISFMIEPMYDPAQNTGIELFMQENYLDPVNFNNLALLNSPVITQKIIAYLSFFRGQNGSTGDQEDLFIRAIDGIMNEISYEQEVYDFVLNYLIDGFERFKMEKVLVHIADNYLSEECETDNEKIMKERLEAYKRMSPGQKVRDINLLDKLENPVRMSELDSDYVLLVFWASWCPHCVKVLPRISEWYETEGREKGIELYTVSIDTSFADWEEFILLNDLKGVNVIDIDGWDGKIARQYNLYATPTIFLLDRERKILAKPLTIRDVRKEVKLIEMN